MTQKSLFISVIFRGIISGIIALVIFILGVGIISATTRDSGGKFGEILNAILLSGDWRKPGNGSVKNAENLGGIPASQYQSIAVGGQSCGENQCMYGFDASGKILCH